MVMDPPSGRSFGQCSTSVQPPPASRNDHAPTSRPGTIPPLLTCKDVEGWDMGSKGVECRRTPPSRSSRGSCAPQAREGRSWEALDRRLSVSASTLHRYCSGATVPEEFAVVDRLAMLCGEDEEAVSAVVDDGLPLRPEPVRSIRRPEDPFSSAEIVLRERLRAPIRLTRTRRSAAGTVVASRYEGPHLHRPRRSTLRRPGSGCRTHVGYLIARSGIPDRCTACPAD
ncbi:helix-turn-helix domain-containing protein [Streptomyces sp. st77]|uniref:helix-turn-helix domain-containing protein n=1 Tax=Streptomyces sp. st77 TaxID=1828074 RepID=UPI00359CAF4E